MLKKLFQGEMLGQIVVRNERRFLRKVLGSEGNLIENDTLLYMPPQNRGMTYLFIKFIRVEVELKTSTFSEILNFFGKVIVIIRITPVYLYLCSVFLVFF